VYLLVASVLEIGWAIGLKFTDGFTKLVPTLLVTGGILASFALVAKAAREIPIGTAYGVFVGIGAGGTGLVGMLMLGEPVVFGRVASLVLIVAGVVALKVFADTPPVAMTRSADNEVQ
jgi:quaternary ammonium compound-resistance protein SugE